MKDEILTNKIPLEINSPGSLPEIINLSQYRYSSKVLYGKNNNSKFVSGGLGSDEFDFQFLAGTEDRIGKQYERFVTGLLSNESIPNNFVNTRNINKITRDSLFERYIIFEIPDYSQLSMSTYYRDFVPHIYLNGCKVWQKYISIIKYYTAKKAYILIMKENNLNSSKENKNLDLSNTTIRICYKNAKEDYDLLATNYSKSELSGKENSNIYSLDSTSFIFYGKLNGDIISDYDYFYKNGDDHIQINPELIKEVNLIDHKGTRTLYSQKNYFRQVAGIDISTNEPNFYNNNERQSTDFEREVSVEIELVLKNNSLDIKNIYLKSKYNNSKAIYKEYLTDSREYKKFNDAELKKYNDIEYNLFDKDGKRIAKIDTTNNDNTDNIEIIPEYSSKRKIILRNSGSDLVSTLNKYVPIYRSNLKNGEILVYDKDGLFKGTTIENESTLIIYDNNEEEDKTVISTGSNNDFDINRNSEKLPDGDEINLAEYTAKKPISTFLMKLSNNNPAPDAYIICRCFPVPLDCYYITKDLVYYKLPDYFYAPKNLYNKTEEYGEYKEEIGENLNKFILDSIEPIIYFNSDVSGCIFYDINNLNDVIYNSKEEKNQTLGNCHIINYNKRYIN